MCDNKNLFSFSKVEGTVGARSSVRIIITFSPQYTMNYYERVFCVVRNHQVLYVDLLGSSFDILTKPLALMQRHVDIFRHKVIMGIHNKIKKQKMINQSSTNQSITAGGNMNSTKNLLMAAKTSGLLTGNSGGQNGGFDDEVEINLESKLKFLIV
jgi:hypothetical protein